MKVPDVKRAFLTGAEGARARTHAAVHHLLPQVVDLGLKATVFWKEKRHRVCQQHLYLQWLFQALVQVLYERRCSLSGAEKESSAAYWGLINDLENRWILIMYLHELCTNISCQIIHYAYSLSRTCTIQYNRMKTSDKCRTVIIFHIEQGVGFRSATEAWWLYS